MFVTFDPPAIDHTRRHHREVVGSAQSAVRRACRKAPADQVQPVP